MLKPIGKRAAAQNFTTVSKKFPLVHFQDLLLSSLKKRKRALIKDQYDSQLPNLVNPNMQAAQAKETKVTIANDIIVDYAGLNYWKIHLEIAD